MGYRNFKITYEGRMFSVSLHRLVWQLAHGDIPPKMTVNHKDGNAANNALDNLELATHSENQKHRYRTLKQVPGVKLLREYTTSLAEALEKALGGDLEPGRVILQKYREWQGYEGPNAVNRTAHRKLSEAARRRTARKNVPQPEGLIALPLSV